MHRKDAKENLNDKELTEGGRKKQKGNVRKSCWMMKAGRQRNAIKTNERETGNEAKAGNGDEKSEVQTEPRQRVREETKAKEEIKHRGS